MALSGLDSLPPMRDIVRSYGISAEKKLGQNFIFDLNLTSRIVRMAGDMRDVTVIEVGPGPGALTRSLLASNAKQVIAIEPDERCLGALEDYLIPVSEGRLKLVKGDALKIDPSTLAEGRVKVVANLPYNVATALLIKWLDNITFFESLTLMFQKEVADRIAAPPGGKAYGRLSIITQWLCETYQEFDIPPQAFFPPPKITSTVINIIPRKQPLAAVKKESLEKLCRIMFSQRRKMLRKSLKQVTSSPDAILAEAEIDPQARPETLTIEQCCCLANIVYGKE